MKWAWKLGVFCFVLILVAVPLGTAWSGPLYEYMAENNKSKAWLAEGVNGELGTGMDTGPSLTMSTSSTSTDSVSTSSSHEITMYGRLFGISPYPVTINTTPEIYIQTSDNVDNVTIQYTWDTGNTTEQLVDASVDPFPFGNRWANDLPNISAPGTRVAVTAIGRNYDTNGNILDEKTINLTSQVTQFTELPQHDTPGPENYNQHHYYTFKDLINVSLVQVKFDGQNLDNTFFTNNQTLRRWQKARQSDIASYYGSPRGLHGQTGINFNFTTTPYGQPQPLPTVNTRNSYTNDKWNTDLTQFLNDVENTVNFNTSKPYIATHPGPPITTAAYENFREAIYGSMIPNTTAVNLRGENESGDSYGVWSHEIGHLLGLKDLYNSSIDGNGIQRSGIMGTEYGEPAGIFGDGIGLTYLPAPFSSLSRTQNLSTQFTNGNAFLTETTHTQSEIQNSDNTLLTKAEALLNKKQGDNIQVINTEQKQLDGIRIYYNIDARGGNSGFRDIERVIIYRKGKTTPSIGTGTIVEAERLNETTDPVNRYLDNLDDYIVDVPTVNTSYFYNFTLVNTTGSHMDYTAWVNTSLTPASSGSTLTTMSGIHTNTTSNYNEWSPSTTKGPDRDLIAVDTKGRIVGQHPKTGKYVNQIPDAQASGNRHQGLEWILIPRGINATFYVDTTNSSKFQELNATQLTLTPTTLTTTHYGNNSQIKGDTVTNTTTTHHTLYPAPDTYTTPTGKTATLTP